MLFLQELPSDEALGPAIIHAAKSGIDFPRQEGWLTFEVGQRNTSLDIGLLRDLASSFATPKRFQVELFNATGGAKVHPRFGMANVTLVSNAASQAVWALLEQLHQPLRPNILNQVLRRLIDTAAAPLSHEQMAAVLEALEKVGELEMTTNTLERHLNYTVFFIVGMSSTRLDFNLGNLFVL